MTVTSLSSTAERRFVEQVCTAVAANDLRALRMAIIMFTELLGRADVERLLDQVVPLELDQQLMPELLRMMLDGEDINTVITDILSELATLASKEGFVLGKDFSYGEDPDTGRPFIQMKEDSMRKLEALYSPSAWKQCRSYLRPIS
ncbi:MAG: hypothetical protein RLZZ11_2018 [Cyanobacteriota bacterium]|jgi:hypothetical protein